MKKIVIAMLLILPLLIVVTVLLSTSIITHTAYIAVEGIHLNVDNGKTLELGLSQKNFQLEAIVEPTGATNKDVVWSIENLTLFGDETKYENPVTVDKNGLVTFLMYSTFDVVATTIEGNKTSRVNFYIKGDILETIAIETEITSVMTGQRVHLPLVGYPLDATIESYTWTSEDENILKVDNNGIIVGVAEGKTKVKVAVDEKIFAEKEITVTKGATKFGTDFYVSKNVLSFSELGIVHEVVAVSNCTVDDVARTITIIGTQAELNIGSRAVTIGICDVNSVVIENKDLLEGKLLRVGKLPIYLNAVYQDVLNDSKVANPIFVSDKNDIIAVVDNKIEPLKKGVATINLEGKAESISFSSVVPINYIRLREIDSDDKRGIAEENLFGNLNFKNGVYEASKYTIDVQYPTNFDWEDFEIALESEEFATIDKNVVTIKDNFVGKKEIVINIKAKYSAYESMDVITQRHLWVVNGVNCSDYATINQANTDRKNIVLRDNVKLSSSDTTLDLYTSLYGNAYMLSGINMPKAKNGETSLVCVRGSDLAIENIHLRFDNGENINTKEGLKGTVLRVGRQDEDHRLNNVLVKYSVIENGYYLISSSNTELLRVEGCIIRNSSNFGVLLSTEDNDNYEIKAKDDPMYKYQGVSWTNMEMHNCVLSNIVATAIGVNNNSDYADVNRGDKKAVNQSKLKSTGFLDIYNWQDILNARMLDRELLPNPDNDPGMDATNKLLGDLAKKAISSEVMRSEYDNIRYSEVSENYNRQYINLGIVTAGALFNSSDDIEIEDPRVKRFPLTRIDDLLGQFDFYPCTLYMYDKTADITPYSTFSENKELYNRLRGEND